MIVWRRLAGLVAEHGAAALVSVHEVRGSAPREAGARMIVRPDGAFHGTIGGGQLEWRMLDAARAALAKGRGPASFLDQALGPDLGQCCGGRVTVLVETFDRQDAADIAVLAEAEGGADTAVVCRLENGRVKRRLDPLSPAGERTLPLPALSAARTALSRRGEREEWRESLGEAPTPLHLFGAGHVGRAIVIALAPLPFAIRWIDSRDDAFPAHNPAGVTPVLSRDPAAELAQAPEDAFVLVMTHEHPLDLAVTAAALQRGFPHVGLIGSLTKRARFEKRFRELGIPEARIRSLVCPIGLPGIGGKEPAVIAASVAAQVLQERQRLAEAALSSGSGVRLRSAP